MHAWWSHSARNPPANFKPCSCGTETAGQLTVAEPQRELDKSPCALRSPGNTSYCQPHFSQRENQTGSNSVYGGTLRSSGQDFNGRPGRSGRLTAYGSPLL